MGERGLRLNSGRLRDLGQATELTTRTALSLKTLPGLGDHRPQFVTKLGGIVHPIQPDIFGTLSEHRLDMLECTRPLFCHHEILQSSGRPYLASTPPMLWTTARKATRLRIPAQTSRRFRLIPAGDSDGSQPLIPMHSSHP